MDIDLALIDQYDTLNVNLELTIVRDAKRPRRRRVSPPVLSPGHRENPGPDDSLRKEPLLGRAHGLRVYNKTVP